LHGFSRHHDGERRRVKRLKSEENGDIGPVVKESFLEDLLDTVKQEMARDFEQTAVRQITNTATQITAHIHRTEELLARQHKELQKVV
jgi:hypothetical protein